MASIIKNIITPLLTGISIKGNVLVYLVLLLLIFGVLGVTILSIFSLASQSASEPNYHRRLSYFRESAIRYASSELKNSDFDPDVIAAINTFSETDDQGYEIGRYGRFKINIFSPWFDADETVNLPDGGGGTLDVRVPEGELKDNWVAKDPQNLWLVNYEYFDLDQTAARNTIASWVKIDDTKLRITLPDNFSAREGDRVCLAAKPTVTQNNISDGGDLYIEEEARYFFPEKHGAININRIDYVYERLIHDSANSRVILEGVTDSTMPNGAPAFPLTVENDGSSTPYTGDFVVLSPRNHIVIPTATWDEPGNKIEIEGTIDDAINIYNLATIQPLTRKPDIDFNEEDLTQALTQIETPNFITEDNTNKTIDIGSGVGGQADFGAAWYDEDKGIGAQNSICETGSCSFGLGIRVFFTLNYSGTADGLTFALINSAGNTFNSAGGDINMSELLAYGGDSRTVADPSDLTQFLDNAGEGLKSPKIAVEFDTFNNNATLEYCSGPNPFDQVFDNRNDPFENNRDAIHFVFWGFDSLTIPCRDYTMSGTPVEDHPTYDDNQHDSGELNQPWSPFLTGGAVRSTPTVADDGTIYVGSDDGHLYAINPSDGTEKWKYPASGSIGAVRSQPAIGNGGVIYFGSEDGKIYAVTPAGALLNSFEIQAGTPVHSPVIGANGKVYVGADNSKFCGFDSTLTTKEWEFPAAGPISYGRPARNPTLGPEGIIYISHRTEASGRIYALNPVQRELDPTGAAFPVVLENEWQFDIGDGNQLMPGIDQVTGTIYSDRSGNRMVAITATGNEDWEYVFGSDFDSTPVVGADGTVYFGADDGKLYAINPFDRAADLTENTLNPDREWTFPTGGEVDSNPAIAPDGTILVVSNDGTLYAVNPDGSEKWNFPIPVLAGLPNSSPTVGNQGVVYVGSSGDNQLYAINDFALPRNIKDNVITSVEDGADVRVAGEIVTVDDVNDWLTGSTTNGPWAVRLEVLRGQTQNANLNYDYNLRFWIRQCNSVACDNILGTFFQDTRIEYAPTPDLFQMIELTPAEHSDFNRFLFGFTGATGSTTTQSAIIADFLLSFIRLNDPIAGN